MPPSFLLFETGFTREKSHLCCKDHLWKPFAFCLLAMYWFDPLVWASYWLACRDIEFACDERVIRALKMPERKAYASALLACSDGRKRVLVCPVAFGETAVVQRIRNVLNYMLYRDTQGLYGETGTVHMFNPESAELNIFTGLALRRLPTFWMVKP